METHPCSWVENINIVKLSILSEVTYRFKILFKMSMAFLRENRKQNTKILVELQKILSKQSSLEQKKTKLQASYILI